MTVVLYIALFGALGCLARYFVSGWVHELIGPTLPYGTLAVNVLGAFLIGWSWSSACGARPFPPRCGSA